MLAMAPKYNDPNKLVTINSQIVLKVKKFLEIPHNSVDSGLLSSCIMMVALLPPTLRGPIARIPLQVTFFEMLSSNSQPQLLIDEQHRHFSTEHLKSDLGRRTARGG